MSEQPNELQVLAQSLQFDARLLSSAASMKGDGEKNDRDQPVQQILGRCAELARGAASLGKESNAVALVILARAILENLILLLWVEISDANAREFSQAKVAELARVARINLESGKLKVMNRQTGEDATEQFLASGRFKKLPKRKSVVSQAEEAGVADLYNVFYRFLSIDTHGHEISRADGKYASELAVIYAHTIGAFCKAAGHAGTRWLARRERTDNETLRTLLGLAGLQGSDSPPGVESE